MVKANKLEKLIFRAAKKSQKVYKDMTDRWWLWRGAESIIQMQVAFALVGTYFLDTESSPTKINDDKGLKRVGRPPKNKNHRFDIIIWSKATDKIRAIIEIKRAYQIGALAPDAAKIRQYASATNSDSFAGYILFYSVSKSRIKLTERIQKSAGSLNATIVGSYISDLREKDKWEWSMALL